MLLAILCGGMVVMPAWGDVVWLKTQQDPLYGIVQSDDGQALTLLKTTNGTDFESVVLQRSEIKMVLVNIDSKSLEALAPDEPQSYFEQAEVLVSQKKDPVARQLAIRLFLIAANHASEKVLQESAIRNLISLARTKEEAKRFQWLAWLETGGTEPWLRTDESKNQVSLPARDLKRALRAVQALRQGRRVELSGEWPNFENWAEAISQEELIAMSKEKELNDQQLARLVALEFRLRNPDQTQSPKPRLASWAEMASRQKQADLIFPTLENVTEFDPAESVYRKGKWVRP